MTTAVKTMVVDGDGHILEPSDLWVKRIEPRYRDMAMRFEKDENGLEYWWYEGKKEPFLSNGTSANMATIGKSADWRKKHIYELHDVSWEDGRKMNPPACDPDERVKMMDREGIDKSILYPSLGLSWVGITDDPGIAAAYCRVYNDWLYEFCGAHPNRLYPAIMLPWTDVAESVKELRRTAGFGPRAVMVPAAPPHDIPYGDRHWDLLWAEFVDQDQPPALHVSAGGTSTSGILYPQIQNPSWWVFSNVTNLQLSFMSFFQGGVFDRFPGLKLVILESGTLWVPYQLERMDEKYEVVGFTTESSHKPSYYFDRQCWVSMEPNDEHAPIAIRLLGADHFLWAYDYPHSDSCSQPVKLLKDCLKELTEEDQRKVIGENALKLYKLS